MGTPGHHCEPTWLHFGALWEPKGIILELFWFLPGAASGNCNILRGILQFGPLWGTLGRHFFTKFQENVLGGTREAIFHTSLQLLGQRGAFLSILELRGEFRPQVSRQRPPPPFSPYPGRATPAHPPSRVSAKAESLCLNSAKAESLYLNSA